MPVQFDQSTPQLLGALLTLRQLIPLVKEILDSPDCERDAEQRLTHKGTVIKLNQAAKVTQDQLLMVKLGGISHIAQELS